MKILGIYNGHTASACLMEDGKVTHCVSEERFTGVKNQTGYPKHSIQYILNQSGITIEQIDYIVLPQTTSSPMYAPKETKNDGATISLINIIYKPISYLRKIVGIISYYVPAIIILRVKAYHVLSQTIGKFSLEKEKNFIAQSLNISKEKIIGYDHHTSHAAASYYSSVYNNEKTLVLTMDGEGDGICASVNIFEKNKITTLAKTTRDRSLGLIYMYLTGYLGMKMTEHEYKVMGLAPYAKDYSVDKLYKKIEDIITLDPSNPLIFKSKFHTSQTPYYLEKTMKGERFDNIAGAFQKLTENIVIKWVAQAITETGIHNICLSGGVFMNVKLNQKIKDMPEVENLYVLPSCGDESSIIGAAHLCRIEKEKSTITNTLDNLYLGPLFSNQDIKAFLDENEIDKKYKIEFITDIEKEIARILAEGNVVARVAGRMEFGARALGNRSILANPSNPDVVMTINEQMKDRDFWMPFAPSIIREREKDYILNPKGTDNRFMMIAFESTPLARKELKAALHPYDFTCRPQVVDKDINQQYWKLIKEFENLTGIGGVLNTSFNLHGYPIVLGPKEALYAFENSGLQYLAMENYLISKL